MSRLLVAILCLFLTCTKIHAEEQDQASSTGHHQGHDQHLSHNEHASHSHQDQSSNDKNPGADSHQHNHQQQDLLLKAAGEGEDWITEKNGSFLPLELIFKDENGTQISLGEIIDRPTIFLPNYYFCPNTCSKNLASLATALTRISATPGRDYRVIAMSFNDRETPEDASRAKKNYMKIVGEDFPQQEWFFLTGQRQAIVAATEAMGYRYKALADGTYIHPSALVVVAADGRLIRYVYGSFLPGDIDMAILDAERGTPSLSVKRLLDFCFNYDPDQNKSIFNGVKIAILAISIFAAGLFVFYLRKKGPRP